MNHHLGRPGGFLIRSLCNPHPHQGTWAFLEVSSEIGAACLPDFPFIPSMSPARFRFFTSQAQHPHTPLAAGSWALRDLPPARGARPSPPTHVTSGPAPAPARPAPSALPLAVREALRLSRCLCCPSRPFFRVSAAASTATAGENPGSLPGWPRATTVASASSQRLPQGEARRSRSHLGLPFSLSCRRRGSWRSGRGRGTGLRGSNGR